MIRLCCHNSHAQLCVLLEKQILLQGGNDHEIYESPKTEGHSVTTPIDTMTQCKELFIDPVSV